MKSNKSDAAAHVAAFLACLGLDIDTDDLRDTPRRITDMYIDFFRGQPGSLGELAAPTMTVFPNVENYDEMILLANIDYVSICSHHFLPFTGTASVAYVPDTQIIGISKLARLLDYYAARPQLQERLAKQVAEGIQDLLKPKGVAVYIKGSHGCIACRGAHKPTSVMITSLMTGCFKNKQAGWREDFLQAVR